MPIRAKYDREEIEALLAAALPKEELTLLKEIAVEAGRRNLPLYLVGGFVRDLLLGSPGQDFDLVVEGDGVALAKAVADRFGGRVTVHPRFRTAQWFPPPASGLPDSLDFITSRSETYAHDGALPTVKPGSVRDDLQRRDFTINTLALRLDGVSLGELRNELGGLNDLENHTIRVLHPDSYRDDPTRILRAVRYEQRYDFKIAVGDLKLIASARSLLDKLSADRLRHELDLILEENRAAAMLGRLAGLGILACVHPGLRWDTDLERTMQKGMAAVPASDWGHLPVLTRVSRRSGLGYLLWLTRLSLDAIRSLDERLHFPAALREALLASSELYRRAPGLAGKPPSTIVAHLEKIHPQVLFANYLWGRPETQRMIDRYMSSWRHIKPRINGSDLVRRGLAPGPSYDRILRGLRNAWLDGKIHSQAEEREMLSKYLGENNHI